MGLYLDTYSQHIFGYKYKMAGSVKTTVDSLDRTFHEFAPWETFMSNGGKHFDNKEVRELCKKWGTKTHIIPAYSPWVNGLIEGTNKLFLHILKQLCAPDLNSKEIDRTPTDSIPETWPDHFDETVRILNWLLLPSLKFSPKELMLGLVINTKPTNINTLILPVTEFDIALQMAYVTQQCLDRYAEAVAHALKRKNAFDKTILTKKPGEVVFSKGQLVQIYRNDLDYTFKTERKLLPKWSPPQRVRSRHLNSYTLENLSSEPLPGSFSARQLRRFIPGEGTKLVEEQKLIKERCAIEEEERSKKEADEIARERLKNTQEPKDDRPRQVCLGNEGVATENGGRMEYVHTPNLSFQDL